MRAPKRKTEVRQEQIARSAVKLIARRGFHNLSVAALAAEVGVTPSDFYRHFKNKDAVLDAVLDLIAQRLLENVEIVSAESPSSVRRLQLLLERHVGLILSGVPIPRIIFSEEIFTGDRRRRKKVRAIFNDYLGHVARFVEEGQRAGEIRPEWAPHTLSMVFLGLIQPAAILWLIGEGDFDLGQHVSNAWQTFHTLLQTAPATLDGGLQTTNTKQ